MCNGWDGIDFDCCNVNDVGPPANTTVAEAQTDTDELSPQAWPALAVGQQIDIVENMANTNACQFGTSVNASTVPEGIVGHVLFYAGHAAARFRYVFVVSIGS